MAWHHRPRRPSGREAVHPSADEAVRGQGQTVADVGCGPGNVTTGLAAAVAPDGLAVGLDISTPMLSRAAAQARANMGLVRADAAQLPLRTASVDAACATAVVMLVPDPQQAVREITRVLTPGGWLLIMAPSRPAGTAARLTRPVTDLLGRLGGARMFDVDELVGMLEAAGCGRIHSHRQGSMLTLTARTPTGRGGQDPAAGGATDKTHGKGSRDA